MGTMSDDSNATALHEISVMADTLDKSATATVSFIHHYAFWFVVAAIILVVSCVISRCIDVAKTLYCLCSPCTCLFRCCCRRKPRYHQVGGNRDRV